MRNIDYLSCYKVEHILKLLESTSFFPLDFEDLTLL